MRRFWLAGLMACAMAQSPEFEVAAIKPFRPDGSAPVGIGCSFETTRVECTGGLKELIRAAYQIADDRILGPPWLTSQRVMEAEMFSVTAKAPPGVPESRRPELLQKLLADRFHMAVHREQRPLPVYALLVDGKASKLKPAGGKPGRNTVGASSFDFNDMTIEDLVVRLREVGVGLPIVDETHLDGHYDMKLEWTPDSAAAPLPNRPDLFTALREQLGLRLVKRSAPIDVVVVDRAARTPTEN